MDSETWRRVRELFDSLVDLPAQDWAQRLTELGVDDPRLRAEVMALLDADREDVIRTGVSAQAPDILFQLADDDEKAQLQRLVGQRVGPFRLVRELGHGGMGTVWLAERDDGEFEQQVAIKLIRAGWDAAELLARFRAERQILAGLTHPNIARLIDGGVVDDDRPWLALEYVDGIELPKYCDRARLTLSQRLRLFLAVCDVVSHAHARLVVHRDLKPSNLLVTSAGQVKLLDFGIAKLLGDESAQATATRMFTPEYAAPEQIRGEAVTTAVDVYALGLLLYELLAGQHPHRKSKASGIAYERAVLELEPARPSVTATRSAEDVDPAAVAALRDLTPERLRRELRGDLDAIVMKALRKDPAQRYGSVAEMAADIQNYLTCRPVVARKGGWRYLAGRFVRRHALAMALTAITLLALSGGLAVALWQADEARSQRDLAQREGGKANQTVDFLLDIFRSADPALTQGRKVTAEELLQRGVDRIDQHHFDDVSVRYDLMLAMGEAYLGIGNTGDAFDLFQRALVLQESNFPEDTLKRVRGLVFMSYGLNSKDDYELAGKYLEEATQLLPISARETELAARLFSARGVNHIAQARPEESARDLEEAYALFRKLRGPTDLLTVRTAITLSWAYDDLERTQDARVLLEPIVDNLRSATDTDPVQLADALDALANTYLSRQDASEASDMRREALEITKRVYGDNHIYVITRLNNLIFSLLREHDYVEANRVAKEAVERSRELLAPDSTNYSARVNNLASTEYALGHWAEAERQWSEALRIRRTKNDVIDIAFSLMGTASTAREQGRLSDARERIEEALGLLRAHPSPRPSILARALIEYTEVDLAEGIVSCSPAEEAAGIMRATAGADDPVRLYVDVVAAGCAWRAEDTPATRQRLDEAQRAIREEFPPGAARLKQADRYLRSANG